MYYIQTVKAPPSSYQVVISREEEEEMTSDSSGDEESGDGGLSSIMRTRIRGQLNALQRMRVTRS